MKYSFKRDGTPAKLAQLLARERSLQPAFRDMRRGLLEDIESERSEAGLRLHVALYVDYRGAHSKVVVIR